MDKWYINRFTLIGIVLIVIGLLIYRLEFLHTTATSIFYPLLLGSSEGKLVLFLGIMGSLLILNSLISSGKFSTKFAFMDIQNSRRYLKYAVILILITYLTSILIEIWLRISFGVSLFTVFVSLNPDVSSTSIMHSHVFKSALGSLLNLGTFLPSNIHTGDSLFRYISPVAYLIVITLPMTYFTSLIAMDSRMGHYKMIIAFAASLAMIGMVDGGLFSNPAIIGFAGLIGMYFIKEPFSPKDLIKPVLIVLLIIITGLVIEIGGSNQNNHQITLIGQTEPVNWNGYNVLSTENNTYVLYYNDNDRKNLLNLFTILKGKSDAFFITWNFYSYF
ncbi:MAG TPA: hypothetical protein VMC48_02140 [Methanobacterium sp.]|nr:hypothetical protein [Methanobacterium sp.]